MKTLLVTVIVVLLAAAASNTLSRWIEELYGEPGAVLTVKAELTSGEQRRSFEFRLRAGAR